MCGRNDGGMISCCYNTVPVKGNLFGGVYGENINNGEITNCYYLKEEHTSDGGRTAAEFVDGSVAWLLNTSGIDFNNESYNHTGVWSQGAEYPIFADDAHKATYKISAAVSGGEKDVYYTDSD